MLDGLFRELKAYTLQEIAENLKTNTDEIKVVLEDLKQYGIIKAIKADKKRYEELAHEDIIITDVIDEPNIVRYVFDFVGVVVRNKYVFKCYPKYIETENNVMQKLKTIMKVIKKYNENGQIINLYNGKSEEKLFNNLAIELHILEDYFENDLYDNIRQEIEINGQGEVLWNKTIEETFTLIKNNKPYYVELYTENNVSDETDYFKKLHACIISLCSKQLKKSGLLELFELEEAEISNIPIEEFGDYEYILYKLEREMQVQFVTKKQSLLKTLYTYVANNSTDNEKSELNLYGTSNFDMIWENICADNFNNMLNKKLKDLPIKLHDDYKKIKQKKLIEIIDKPIWYSKDSKTGIATNTLKPDLITIYNYENNKCFYILDAKYYYFYFSKNKIEGNNPGVGDVTKQYIYQLAYEDFMDKHNINYVQNAFLCPADNDKEGVIGHVEMKIMHNLIENKLVNIKVVKLNAEKVYNKYLGINSEEMTKYLPIPERRKEEYPEIIKADLGARQIYDIISNKEIEFTKDKVSTDVFNKEIDITKDNALIAKIINEKLKTLDVITQEKIKNLYEEICETKNFYFSESDLKEILYEIFKLL